VNVYVKIIHLRPRENARVFAEVRQFVKVRQQFFGLAARTIVERVHEIKGEVPSNEFEFRWAPSLKFRFCHVKSMNFPAGFYNHQNALDKLIRFP
jgi:hypothetical protein